MPCKLFRLVTGKLRSGKFASSWIYGVIRRNIPVARALYLHSLASYARTSHAPQRTLLPLLRRYRMLMPVPTSQSPPNLMDMRAPVFHGLASYRLPCMLLRSMPRLGTSYLACSYLICSCLASSRFPYLYTHDVNCANMLGIGRKKHLSCSGANITFRLPFTPNYVKHERQSFQFPYESCAPIAG